MRGVGDPLVDFILAQLPDSQAVRHVLIDGHVRVQGVILKHHGDVAFAGRQIIDLALTNEEVAAGNVFQPGDHPERGTFRTAGRPDQHHKFPIVDIEVDTLHRLIAAGIDFPDFLQGDLCHDRVPLSLHPSRQHAGGDVSLEDKR
jgi:hypothetical protein